MSFQDTTAVITGGGQGIGLAIADHLAAKGATIVLSDVNQTVLEEATDRIIAEHGGKAVPVPCDVTKRDQIVALCQAAKRETGRLDFMVNNAGICPPTPWQEITPEEWDLVMAVNLKGVFFCCQVAGPLMVEQGGGAILNMASISGRTARAVAAHYSSSKAAVIGLTKNFANWLAPEVRVNAIAPGPVESDMTRALPQHMRDAITAKSLLGGMSQVADIAEAAGFLLSPLTARHITGITLDINAGQFMD
jgi:3-oxoacyl-[acyl-carrier protein] reductase